MKEEACQVFCAPCLPKHIFMIFLICLFFEYLAQHFDTFMDRSAVKPGNDLSCWGLTPPPRRRLDPGSKPPWSPQRCHWLLLFQLCALWTSTSTTSPHKLSDSHFTLASLLIHRFTTGRRLTFLNTKPWSSHKCSQLPSQRQLTNMILPLKTLV